MVVITLAPPFLKGNSPEFDYLIYLVNLNGILSHCFRSESFEKSLIIDAHSNIDKYGMFFSLFSDIALRARKF